MTDEPPPWARPRSDDAPASPARRVFPQAADPGRKRGWEPDPEPGGRSNPEPGRGDASTTVGPPPGPRPPAATGGAGSAAPRRDPHVGLVTGPVKVTAVAETQRTGVGVVAVAMSAVIVLAALVAAVLAGRAGPVLLLVGSAVAVLAVAAVAGAHRVAIRRGTASVCRFALRAETGTVVAYTLRGADPAGAPHTGDLVRVVPGRDGTARVVEVLAGLHGPVVRRVTGSGLLAPVQWAGLGLAFGLLAFAGTVLNGAF